MAGVAFAALLGGAAGAAGLVSFAIAGSAILGGAVLYGGIALASRLLAPKAPSLGSGRGDTRKLITASVYPARWVLGRARIGGMLTYYLEPEDNDRDVYAVLTLCEGPIEGVEKIWIDGEEVQWTGNVEVGGTASPGLEITFPQSKYGENLSMWFAYDGGAGGFAEHMPSDTQWTAAHQLYGKASVLIKMTQPDYGNDVEKRIFYKFPTFEFLVKGQKFAWPGSTGTLWTENAAAVYYWWLTTRRQVPGDAIHLPDFFEAVNICGRTVNNNLPPGYEDFPATSMRYAVNGVIYSDDDHESVEDELDFAWAGYNVEINGIYHFRPGIDRAPVYTIGPEDIIQRGRVIPAPALSDRLNAGSMRLAQSASHDWTEFALPEIRDEAAITRDGRRLPKDFNRRSFVCCPVSGGRLLALMLRRARANKIYQYRIHPGDRLNQLALVPSDRVYLNDPDYGLDKVPAVITARQVNGDMSIDLSLEYAPDGLYSDEIILPPGLGGRYHAVNVLRGPAIPTGVAIYAEAVLTDDYTVRSTIHISWEGSPNRTRVVVERIGPGPGTFRIETVVTGNALDVEVPMEGAYRVSLWHLDNLNVLSRAYTQVVLVDWSSLGITSIFDRVKQALEDNPTFANLEAEAEKAIEAATNADASAQAAAGDASAAAGHATSASSSADKAGNSATAAAASATKASVSAGSASTSVSQASSAATTAKGHATSAQVSAQAAAGSATAAGRAVAGITATVSSNVQSYLSRELASAVVLRTEAGSAGSRLELVSLSNFKGAKSAAKLRADEIIFDSSNLSVDRLGKLKVNEVFANNLRTWNRITTGFRKVQTSPEEWVTTSAVGSLSKYSWLAFFMIAGTARPRNVGVWGYCRVSNITVHSSSSWATRNTAFPNPGFDLGWNQLTVQLDSSGGIMRIGNTTPTLEVGELKELWGVVTPR